MDLKRKLEIANTAIASISRHDDEDAQVLSAALDKVVEFVESERKAITDRVAARAEEALG